MSAASVLQSPSFPQFGDVDGCLPTSTSSFPSNTPTHPQYPPLPSINKSLWSWFHEFMVEVKRARRSSMLTFVVEEECEHLSSYNASSSASMSLATYRKGHDYNNPFASTTTTTVTTPTAAVVFGRPRGGGSGTPAAADSELTTPFNLSNLKRAFSATSVTEDDGLASSGNTVINNSFKNIGVLGGAASMNSDIKHCPSPAASPRKQSHHQHTINISSARSAPPQPSSGGTTQRSRRGGESSKLTESIKAMGRADLEEHMEKAVRLIFQLIKSQTASSASSPSPPPPHHTHHQNYQSNPLSTPPIDTPSSPLENTLLSSASTSHNYHPLPFVRDRTPAPHPLTISTIDDNDNDDNLTPTTTTDDDNDANEVSYLSSSFGSDGYHRVTSLEHHANAHNPRRRSVKKSIKESRSGGGGTRGNLGISLTRPTINVQVSRSFDIDDLMDSNSLLESTEFIRHVMVQKERDTDGNRILNGYVLVKEIGSGSYGKVRLAYERDNQHKKFAVKCVPRCGGLLGRRVMMGAQHHQQQQYQQQQQFTKEVAIMKALRHKNIVTLHAVVDDPEAEKVYMVMEYIEGGNLLDEETSPSMKANGFIYKPLPEVLAVKYMRQLVGGLRYLHKHRIAHRDIKPTNILRRKSDDTVFIADFGTAELGTYLTTMEELNSTFSASVEKSMMSDEPPPGSPAAAFMITEIESGGGSYAGCVGGGGIGSSSFETAEYEPDHNIIATPPALTTTTLPLPHQYNNNPLQSDDSDDQLQSQRRHRRRPLAVYGQKGTPMFWSPEMFRATTDREYFVDGEAQDTWALGVTLFMMLTGKSPFKATLFHQLKEEIGGATEVTIPDTLSRNVQRLLRSMLQKDQWKRCTLLEVRESSLLADVCDGEEEVYSGSPLLGNLIPPLKFMNVEDDAGREQQRSNEHNTPPSQNMGVFSSPSPPLQSHTDTAMDLYRTPFHTDSGANAEDDASCAFSRPQPPPPPPPPVLDGRGAGGGSEEQVDSRSAVTNARINRFLNIVRDGRRQSFPPDTSEPSSPLVDMGRASTPRSSPSPGSSISTPFNVSTSAASTSGHNNGGGYSSPTRHTQRVVVSSLSGAGGDSMGGGYSSLMMMMPPQQLLTTSTTLCGSISRSIRTSSGMCGSSTSQTNSHSTHPLSRI